MNHTFVIAEAGVNHNGSIELAHQLVDRAADAQADAVKFQTFRADRLASRLAPKAGYQVRETGAAESQLDMLRALELPDAAHRELRRHCADRGIEFMSSPFDHESLAFLVELGVDRIKLGSGELTNALLLLAAARTGLPLIISTGMATLVDVANALDVIAFGVAGGTTPSRAAFAEARRHANTAVTLRDRVTLLHCTTEYPTPPDQVNLRAMLTMRDEFGLPCGFSDHTEGWSAAVAAVALGATMLEKHFTLDRTLPGPDHKASLEPDALKAMVAAIRATELALGDGVKAPMPAEIPNMAVARKSVVAARAITKGEVITADSLTIKRPGTGRSPFDFWKLLGAVATRDYFPDDEIE